VVGLKYPLKTHYTYSISSSTPQSISEQH